MRHRKNTVKLGRTTSHGRSMFANMLKSLIHEERIMTTVEKAKELRRHADRMITLAKENSLASRRRAIAALMIRYNALTPKEARAAKEGDESAYNIDRKAIKKLFETLGPRFAQREGGYTRLVKAHNRVGDNAQLCVIEYLSE
ncbi:MAG: 50S ribosomal protein L17 [Verrucomicrobia bacterium]|nr:50S ribosomal protein L17 [Verrucomicrobiota bacterium]MBS0647169.1 50S ribosomal protein L17 [Verrucomicrobiota bacterium]